MATLHAELTVPLRRFAVDLELKLHPGTLALVGPSGSGKTTVLRAIAGLLRPAAGRVALGDSVWFDASSGIDLPPERRSVGFVFQEYALFPHLSVRDNVEFAGAHRASELLERLGIAHLAGARPSEVSGGERQRVAVARALARDPGVLLLDEPLAALDAHTRAHVRAELQEVLAGLGRPAVVVTHDFADATALASRIGVLADGRLRQLGTPEELLARPADRFVAALTGGNLLVGEAEPAGDGTTRIRVPGGAVSVQGTARGRVGVAVHPWDVRLARAPGAAGGSGVRGRIAGVAPAGGRVRLTVGALGVEVASSELAQLGLEAGDEAWAIIDPHTARLVDPIDG